MAPSPPLDFNTARFWKVAGFYHRAWLMYAISIALDPKVGDVANAVPALLAQTRHLEQLVRGNCCWLQATQTKWSLGVLVAFCLIGLERWR
jgi:hypothetical protein